MTVWSSTCHSPGRERQAEPHEPPLTLSLERGTNFTESTPPPLTNAPRQMPRRHTFPLPDAVINAGRRPLRTPACAARLEDLDQSKSYVPNSDTNPPQSVAGLASGFAFSTT